MPESPIVIERVVPGAFYQGVYAGGFTDAVTGIHIPGPIVNIHPVTRGVDSVHAMPDPVQIPQLKRSFNLKDNKIQEDAAFDRIDAEATAEGLNMALSTGIIRRISDEHVKELYPQAWANRSDSITFNPNGNTAVPMAKMVDDFQTKLRAAKAGVAERRTAADEMLGETRRVGRPAGSTNKPKKTTSVVVATETATE